jgi:hypothetical protein
LYASHRARLFGQLSEIRPYGLVYDHTTRLHCYSSRTRNLLGLVRPDFGTLHIARLDYQDSIAWRKRLIQFCCRFHQLPEQTSGSISTSPSSNNSSAVYSFAGSQRPSFTSPLSLPNIHHNHFPHAQPLSNNSTTTFHLPSTFSSGMQTRP